MTAVVRSGNAARENLVLVWGRDWAPGGRQSMIRLLAESDGDFLMGCVGLMIRGLVQTFVVTCL